MAIVKEMTGRNRAAQLEIVIISKVEITEDKGQEIKKHDDNSPYLRGLVVEVRTECVNTHKVLSLGPGI